MKTATYLRIFIASVTMTAIACSDPVTTDPPPPPPTPADRGEYHTSVTTWVRSNDGRFTGLVTQTPNTDLSTVDVFVVEDGKRLQVYGQLDARGEPDYHSMNGEYFWASIRNNVLLLHYFRMTGAPPPFPLEVIIVY